jgi:hypothetical protein
MRTMSFERRLEETGRVGVIALWQVARRDLSGPEWMTVLSGAAVY